MREPVELPVVLGQRAMIHGLAAAIHVFEANDVILAEIGATLYFDHDQIEFPRILETMFVTSRNVGGLVGAHEQLPITIDNLGGARYDNPVLAAVMMHL